MKTKDAIAVFMWRHQNSKIYILKNLIKIKILIPIQATLF